jgi:hypothetical protein
MLSYIVTLKSEASNEEEFNGRLLTFLREMDEETYILLSGRTKYQNLIMEKIKHSLNAWNPSERIDFLKKLDSTVDTSITNSTLLKLNEEINNAVSEKI